MHPSGTHNQPFSLKHTPQPLKKYIQQQLDIKVPTEFPNAKFENTDWLQKFIFIIAYILYNKILGHYFPKLS